MTTLIGGSSAAGGNSAAYSDRPYIMYASSDRPPGSSSSYGGGGGGGGGGGAHGRDPVQALCPYTGSNVTGVHPLRVVAGQSSSGAGAFGVRCLIRVPSSLGCGRGDGGGAALFVGHGGAAGGGKDEHAFLVGGEAPPSSNGGGNPLRWRIRPPRPLSRSPQSMAASPDGRHLAACCADGSVLLWEWRDPSGDNLAGSWRAHHRPASCAAFDPGDTDGSTLFTGGEDGVVSAWSLVDVVGGGGGRRRPPALPDVVRAPPPRDVAVRPTRVREGIRPSGVVVARSESRPHGARGGGDGTTGRTLARICLPAGIRTVISDATGGRLYCGGADGTVYVVDLCEFAVRESSASGDGGGGCGSFAYANDGGEGGGVTRAGGDAALGDAPSHVSELRGHAKAVTCLALLDPSDLAARSSGGDDVGGVGTSPTLLASGSEDGTIRVWDLRARSCVRVLRPWSGSSCEGGGANVASSSTSSAAAPSPPVTSIVIVPRSSLTSHGGASLAMSSADRCSGRRRDADGCSASPYRPLRGFVRGSSVISHGGGDDGVDDAVSSSSSGGCAPILWPRRDESFAGYWEGPTPAATNGALLAATRKRTRRTSSSRGGGGEVDRLRKELAESKRTIERWQAVNNQLMSKLKSKGCR